MVCRGEMKEVGNVYNSYCVALSLKKSLDTTVGVE